jgi:7,8-dihydroneopterin aldolase/epimerase/oxygenase
VPSSIKSPHLILLILLIRGSTTRMQSTKIELKELVFFARHGVLAEEAALGQRFRVDVVASLDPSLDLTQDRPESTVNYVELFETVQAIFTEQRFNLIESAADAMAGAILEQFPKVQSVTVKVKKPSVPVDCICDYFAAEVTRCR